MKLEVLTKSPSTPSQFPPILLIHGSWHGAWCWEDNFLDYFAAKGWDTHAMSLRGHGKSEGHEKLRWWSIADYVADVQQVVDSLESEPIIIGHSMGGFVAQKYLETHSARAAVLLASVPPSGSLHFNLRFMRRHPLLYLMANLTQSVYFTVKNPAHAREWLLSEGISEDDLASYHAKLQDESYRASWDMLALNLPKPRLVKTPIAVLGAEHDAIVSVKEVEKAARAYGVEAKIFPSMAHCMMLEPNWKDVADWIVDEFFNEIGL